MEEEYRFLECQSCGCDRSALSTWKFDYILDCPNCRNYKKEYKKEYSDLEDNIHD